MCTELQRTKRSFFGRTGRNYVVGAVLSPHRQPSRLDAREGAAHPFLGRLKHLSGKNHPGTGPKGRELKMRIRGLSSLGLAGELLCFTGLSESLAFTCGGELWATRDQLTRIPRICTSRSEDNPCLFGHPVHPRFMPPNVPL